MKDRILELLLGQEDPNLKRSVARRVAEKIALEILRNRLSSWGPVHISTYNLTYLIGQLPFELTKEMVEQLCRQIIYGEVIPLQEVKETILEASHVYMGVCACRVSKRTKDLYESPHEKKHIYTRVEENVSRALMDDILNTYLQQRDDGDVETGPEMASFLQEMFWTRDHRRDEYGIEKFWQLTYPMWEILLDHDDYTDAWKTSQQKTKKARRVNKHLLIPIIDALYQSRGIIFSAMSMFDARYAICSCPGPENDRGCLLFNWHYYSGIDPAIKHNTSRCFGQRREKSGRALPCRIYPERMRRECLGCGCEHNEEDI